ncbi:MAG: PepSY-associated TM helix domain-containing protein [Gammaproteobacteria bacterium]
MLLAIVGLTGSILVFYQELQGVVNPEFNIVSVPAEGAAAYRPLDEIVAAAERAKPAGSHFEKIYYPRHEEIAFKLLYFVSAPERANNGDGYHIFIDPYTAKVKGVQLWHPKGRVWKRPLVSFIMYLHWCLLLGSSGGVIVGILAVLSIFSVLTGLIVWWPLTGKFRQALTFKRNAGAARFNFDLHKTVGIYTIVMLLPILFSSVYFNLPDQVNTVVRQFSPLERPNAFNGISADVRSSKPDGRQALMPGQVEAIVRRHYPSGKLWMIKRPSDPDGVYLVWQRGVDELSRFVGYRDIAVDQYTGRILKVHEAGKGSVGDVLLDWQWSIHSGHAFGWTGRILVFLTGLACPLLFVTGLIRWLQKKRAYKIKSKIQVVRS